MSFDYKAGGWCRIQAASMPVVLPGLDVVRMSLSGLWLRSGFLRWTYRMGPLSGEFRARVAVTDRRTKTNRESGRQYILSVDTLPTSTNANGLSSYQRP